MDIVKVGRIEKALARWPGTFETRIFTEGETAYSEAKKHPALHLAARFAAKEAAFKALGTGYSGGVSWKDAEVVSDGGKPKLVLSGRLGEVAAGMGVLAAHLSLSHDADYAVAYVILTGEV